MPNLDPRASTSSTKDCSMDKQNDQTLSFKPASELNSAGFAEYHEPALQRDWGVNPSKEQMRTTIRQRLQLASNGPIMLQRWQNERGLDQPYDNVGWVSSVSTPGQKQENVKQSQKPEGAK